MNNEEYAATDKQLRRALRRYDSPRVLELAEAYLATDNYHAWGLPEEKRADYLALSAANHYWIEHAEALGWVQLPPLQATVREVRP